MIIAGIVAPNGYPIPEGGQHVTLAFLGEPENDASLSEAVVTEVREICAELAAKLPQFDIPAIGTGPLGDAQVVFLDPTVLTGIHNYLSDFPVISDLKAATEQFPDYTPHMSTGYGDDAEPVDMGESVHLAGLSVWVDGEKYDYMFSGDGVLTADAVTAAAGKWNPLLHPRGKDGKFIRKFGIMKFLDLASKQWSYGKVVGIDTDKKTSKPFVTIRPSSLDGKPTGAPDIDLPPSKLYTAPKKKAHLTIDHKDVKKVGGQGGSNPGGTYEMPAEGTGASADGGPVKNMKTVPASKVIDALPLYENKSGTLKDKDGNEIEGRISGTQLVDNEGNKHWLLSGEFTFDAGDPRYQTAYGEGNGATGMTHLTSYGKMYHKPASDFTPGDVLMFNYGYSGVVTAITPTAGMLDIAYVNEKGEPQVLKKKPGTVVPFMSPYDAIRAWSSAGVYADDKRKQYYELFPDTPIITGGMLMDDGPEGKFVGQHGRFTKKQTGELVEGELVFDDGKPYLKNAEGTLKPVTKLATVNFTPLGSEDNVTGKPDQYYVKKAKTVNQGRNEALANALYEEAGVFVPEVDFNGEDGNIYSKIVDGTIGVTDAQLKDPEWLGQVQSNFAVDAWLANWDVFGMSWDNILTTPDGVPVRIDNGGALLYRAMGTPKGADFGSKVGELDTMRVGKKSAIYGSNMPKSAELDGAQRIAAITPERIDELVSEHKLGKSLADTLKARRKYIADYYGIPLPETMQPAEAEQITSAPLVDPLDSVTAHNMSRKWSAGYDNLFKLSSVMEAGDQIKTAKGVHTIGRVDGMAGASISDQLALLMQEGGPFHVKKFDFGGDRPEHLTELSTAPATAKNLLNYRWQRGDQIEVEGASFNVEGVHRANGTLLLTNPAMPGNETETFSLNVYNLPGNSVRIKRWDPPTASDVKPEPSKKTGMAASVEKAVKADLVTPLPDNGPPKPAKAAPKAGEGIGEPSKSDVKTMQLGDNTVAATGDKVVSKKDGKTYVFVKPKGYSAVVYDVDDPNPSDPKLYMKTASTLTQPGKSPVDIPGTTTDKPKSANNVVPEIGMKVTAKDGKTGTVSWISPDGKSMLFKPEGSNKPIKKMVSTVTLEKADAVPEVVATPDAPGTDAPEAPTAPVSLELGKDIPLKFSDLVDAPGMTPGAKVSMDGQKWYEVVYVGTASFDAIVPDSGYKTFSKWNFSGEFYLEPMSAEIAKTKVAVGKIMAGASEAAIIEGPKGKFFKFKDKLYSTAQKDLYNASDVDPVEAVNPDQVTVTNWDESDLELSTDLSLLLLDNGYTGELSKPGEEGSFDVSGIVKDDEGNISYIVTPEGLDEQIEISFSEAWHTGYVFTPTGKAAPSSQAEKLYAAENAKSKKPQVTPEAGAASNADLLSTAFGGPDNIPTGYDIYQFGDKLYRYNPVVKYGKTMLEEWDPTNELWNTLPGAPDGFTVGAVIVQTAQEPEPFEIIDVNGQPSHITKHALSQAAKSAFGNFVMPDGSTKTLRLSGKNSLYPVDDSGYVGSYHEYSPNDLKLAKILYDPYSQFNGFPMVPSEPVPTPAPDGPQFISEGKAIALPPKGKIIEVDYVTGEKVYLVKDDVSMADGWTVYPKTSNLAGNMNDSLADAAVSLQDTVGAYTAKEVYIGPEAGNGIGGTNVMGKAFGESDAIYQKGSYYAAKVGDLWYLYSAITGKWDNGYTFSDSFILSAYPDHVHGPKLTPSPAGTKVFEGKEFNEATDTVLAWPGTSTKYAITPEGKWVFNSATKVWKKTNLSDADLTNSGLSVVYGQPFGGLPHTNPLPGKAEPVVPNSTPTPVDIPETKPFALTYVDGSPVEEGYYGQLWASLPDEGNEHIPAGKAAYLYNGSWYLVGPEGHIQLSSQKNSKYNPDMYANIVSGGKALSFNGFKGDNPKVNPVADPPAAPEPEAEPKSIPGVNLPSAAEKAAWGGDIMKSGHIPFPGMDVTGTAGMVGKIISVSPDKTKATVLTSDGKKTVRKITALKSNISANYAKVIGPAEPVEVPEGMQIPYMPPAEVFQKAIAKPTDLFGLANGHPGIRNAITHVSGAVGPSGKKYARVNFTLTTEQRAELLKMMQTTGPVEVLKGAWVSTSTKEIGDLVPGDAVPLRLSSSQGEWVIDNGKTAPTHKLVSVDNGTYTFENLTNGGTVTTPFTKKATGSGIMFTANVSAWDPEAPAPVQPNLSGFKGLSAHMKSKGWEYVDSNYGVISTFSDPATKTLSVEPGNVVPSNQNPFNYLYSNSGGFRYKNADGTVIEITSLDPGGKSGLGVVTISIPEGGDTVSAYGAAMQAMGMSHAPQTQENVKKQVLPILKNLVKLDLVNIDTTGNMSETQIFDKISQITGVPGVGWHDVQLGMTDSQGKVTFYWSDRVREALVTKNSWNVVQRGGDTHKVSTIVNAVKHGSFDALARRYLGMGGTGISPDSDANNNANHGSFMSGGKVSKFTKTNDLQMGGGSYMVYYHPGAVLGKIADYRAGVGGNDAFGKGGGNGSNTLEYVANANKKSGDFFVGTGIGAEDTGFVGIASKDMLNKVLAELAAQGITHIGNRPVAEVVMTVDDLNKLYGSPANIPAWTPPPGLVPLTSLPTEGELTDVAV